MTNYVGEMLTIVVGIITATAGIGLIIRRVFTELSKFRLEQQKPYEKALNGLIENCGEGLGAMVKAMNKVVNEDENKKTAEKVVEYDW